MWLVETLFGLLLGYYVISPKCRRFINGFIAWFIGSPTKKPRYVKITKIKKPGITAQAKPVELCNPNNHVEVGDKELEEWFRDNPDLREANAK